MKIRADNGDRDVGGSGLLYLLRTSGSRNQVLIGWTLVLGKDLLFSLFGLLDFNSIICICESRIYHAFLFLFANWR